MDPRRTHYLGKQPLERCREKEEASSMSKVYVCFGVMLFLKKVSPSGLTVICRREEISALLIYTCFPEN